MKARSDRFKRVRKIVVTPAYGRKYSSFMDLLLIYPPCKTGRYINKDDVLIYSPNATVEMLYSGANGVLHGGTIQ